MNLKQKLIEIKENDYQAPPGAFGLVQEMIENIGSPDAELRDELIYTTLTHWIPGNTLTDDELKQMIPVVLDKNHLLFKVGETGTDSVFTRAFSSLVIPLLLIRHRESPYLSREQVHQIKAGVFSNVRGERDYRGYDDEKGWAHAVAHAADALDDLALCAELDANDLLTILNLVQEKMTITERVYTDGEDERMVCSIMSVLKRKILDEADIVRWIQSFGEVEKNPEYIPAFRQKINIKNFLKSLYFRVKYNDADVELCPVIEKTLYKIEKVYYS
ncbi:DUF2785 domain-containing protein [Paenibacillus tengchongensis]|uniref:DUF2785 domain-containing protein n=1 Tax=Paenibacillus tengchongensis TaxID=2608684 RepID=UPI00124BFE84|nr:DUF2785 domain-containing protein [Paenibacillus tengchongensis]